MLLAIDAGGTATRCAAITEDARCVGFARRGPANPISSGLPVAIASLAEAAAEALAQSHTPPQDVHSVTIALAGISPGAALDEGIEKALLSHGIRALVRFDSDAMAGFSAGTAAESGSVLISGTGAAAVRVQAGHAMATADGLGWLLGDVGSGFWIGQHVARAALSHLDGRGPETTLTELLLATMARSTSPDTATDPSRPPQIMRILTSTYAARPVELARLAPLAFDAASVGDAVAGAIIEDAADGLCATLRAVRGAMHDPVVATGGILAKQPMLRRAIEERLCAVGESVNLISVDDGLTGAAVLALRATGISVDHTVHSALGASIDEARRLATTN
ncbi:hypothetical protein IF188_18115 [Microbacterium sp. NEAU-LLC]|uniref:ATPase BadF/BadG/BcrA/BcrD type domain-containing protein n=1 Tax=Microbacterium helvum TaxID=2773713 RepID=A0ABR8NVH9_9MICO|nr:BadF/BadG/BcrA/BcrD ATPase family protein [Microbacterium helvum]MBD3943611.1 hypothetical protein [Microbacterium helvum]